MSAAQIMVVEDENIISKGIQHTLKNLGYGIIALASSGEEAIQKAEATQPDVVLMDIVLKGEIDGIAAAGAIRAHSDVPIIYLTAYADENTLKRAKITEPYAYLLKPFLERELHTAIQIALYKNSMEKKLKEREKWFSITLKSIGDAVIVTDANQWVTYMNPVAEALTGWKQEEANGKPLTEIFNLIQEETRMRVENPVSKVIRKDTIVGLEDHALLIGKSGREIPVDDSAAPIKDERGNLMGVVMTFRDITDRKKAEEALWKSHEELEKKVEERTAELLKANAALRNEIRDRKQAEEALKRNQEELIKKNKEIDENRRSLQLALEELEGTYKELEATQSKILQQEKMASLGQLAAGVAHEINNPIAFISSNLGTLDKYVNRLTEFIQTQSEVIESLNTTDAIEKLKSKQKELKLDYIIEDIKGVITESLDGSERVKKIVQGLKRFARMDEAEHKSADINECIESTINIVWNELKYKATLKKDYGNIPLTKCYPQQMNQVFMNLLINAGHAIEKQGEITIKTRDEDGVILVEISDTGCGIPKESLDKIFEPFFTTKEVGKGTGLGLSITYEIVQKHNGEIAVKSEVGKGTTFTVRIPIV